MPEQYRPKRGLQPYLLSSADRQRALIQARCVGCTPPRWYAPADLMQLFGDIPVINLEGIMRCGTCRAVMNIRSTIPTSAERQRIVLRRLDAVWWVRRVRWRDEKA